MQTNQNNESSISPSSSKIASYLFAIITANSILFFLFYYFPMVELIELFFYLFILPLFVVLLVFGQTYYIYNSIKEIKVELNKKIEHYKKEEAGAL